MSQAVGAAPIVRTAGLVKRYGQHIALDRVDIAVPAGTILGLVGPNGAGKTTLLDLLAGLRRPTAGDIDIAVPRTRLALLPDTPSFEPWLTGYEVVALAQHLVAPDAPAQRIDQVLAQAGLTEAAHRRTGGYSRGMLQRLGLAATVVGEPDLLLLDEPASALDPAGRREVLGLIAHLRGRATVVLSSHLLADIEEVCDLVGILRGGRLLFLGPVRELLVGRAVPAYLVRLRPPAETAVALLRAQPWISDVQPAGPDRWRVAIGVLADAETGLVEVLARAGARVVSLEPQAPSLEDVFLELTS